jgi:hypothetical protein
MKITNKFIEDMIEILDGLTKQEGERYGINYNYFKEEFKEKGYEVEEQKSKLEIAREYKIREYKAYEYGSAMIYHPTSVDWKIKLYEEAIKNEIITRSNK